MKQKVVNKVYFLSIIRENKVIEILQGRYLEDLQYKAEMKYRNCTTQVMEYNDEYNIYVPDVEEHLMMIRRRQMYGVSK